MQTTAYQESQDTENKVTEFEKTESNVMVSQFILFLNYHSTLCMTSQTMSKLPEKIIQIDLDPLNGGKRQQNNRKRTNDIKKSRIKKGLI